MDYFLFEDMELKDIVNDIALENEYNENCIDDDEYGERERKRQRVVSNIAIERDNKK